MEIAVFVTLVTLAVEKVLHRQYKNHKACIMLTVTFAGILAGILIIAVYEKLSLIPVLLLVR